MIAHIHMQPGSTPLFCYSAYGLSIESEIDLNERISPFSKSDVSIRIASLETSELEAEFSESSVFERPGCILRMSADKTWCTWNGLGTTVVRSGKEILVDPLPNVDESDFVPLITGALFGNLLHYRSLLVLHGSSLVVNGRAVAFLGDKGAGKSTLAAHLHQKGHHVLSDDLVPLNFTDECILTYPGFDRIKLWPDSVESIGVNPEQLPRVSRFMEKRSFELTSEKPKGTVELERIYILQIDDEMSFKPYLPCDAFIELARNTYLSRYLNATDSTMENFKQCENVTRTIPIISLNRPHDFKQISRIPELIEADLESNRFELSN